MPTLAPPQTIQIPAAPARVQAQGPRQVRTDDAIEQESASFESALTSAGESLDKASEEIPADSEIAPVDSGSTEVEDSVAEPEQESTIEPESPNSPIESEMIEPEKIDPEKNKRPEASGDAPIETEPLIADVSAVSAPVLNDPIQAPSIAKVGYEEKQEPHTSQPQNPKRLDQAVTVTRSGSSESSVIQAPVSPDTPDTTAPATSASHQEAAQQVFAPIPTQQQRTDPADPANPTSQIPLEGQSVPVDTHTDTGTASDDSNPQGEQRDAGSSAIEIDAARTTPPAEESTNAQPLRQARVESAPGAIEQVSVEPQISQHSGDAQIARPIAPQQATPGPAQSPSLGTVEPDHAFNAAVGRGLAAAVRQQGGTLTIKLDPPTLGKLTIKMTIDQGRVEATFDAQTAQARDLLMEHTSVLRAQLRDRGLTVERIEIIGATSAGKAGQAPASSGDQPGADGEQDSSQQDAAGGQSRGRSETGEEQSSMNDANSGDTAGTAGEPMTSPFEAQLRYSVSAVA